MKRIASYLIIAALAIALGTAGCSKKPGAEGGKADAGKSAPAAAEKAAPEAQTGGSEIAAFGDELCGGAKKNFSAFMKLFSPEFSIRATVTDEQLKAMNTTVDQLIAEQQKAMDAAPAPGDDKAAGECTVGEAKDLSCDELYKLIESKMPNTKADHLTEVGKTMGIEACGTIEMSIAEAGKSAEKASVAVGKIGGKWIGLMPLMDAPPAQ